MDSMMSPGEMLTALLYAPCWIAGLVGGLVTRRRALACAIGFVLAPLGDIALSTAFSDAPPRFVWQDSLVFAFDGAILAFLVRVAAEAIGRARRRGSQP